MVEKRNYDSAAYLPGWYADRRGGTEKRKVTRDSGRVCQQLGCGTTLSVYNPDDLCAPCMSALTRVQLEMEGEWT